MSECVNGTPPSTNIDSMVNRLLKQKKILIDPKKGFSHLTSRSPVYNFKDIVEEHEDDNTETISNSPYQFVTNLVYNDHPYDLKDMKNN